MIWNNAAGFCLFQYDKNGFRTKFECKMLLELLIKISENLLASHTALKRRITRIRILIA